MDVEELGCLKCGQRVAWIPWGTLLGCAWLLTAPQAVGLYWKHSGSLGCQTLNLECCPSCHQRRGERMNMLRKGPWALPNFPVPPPRACSDLGGREGGGRGLDRSLVRGQFRGQEVALGQGGGSD